MAEARYSRLMRFFAPRFCLGQFQPRRLAEWSAFGSSPACGRGRGPSPRSGDGKVRVCLSTRAAQGEEGPHPPTASRRAPPSPASGRRARSGRASRAEIGGASIIVDVAGAAPQLGGFAPGEHSAALDGEAVVIRLERLEMRDMAAAEDVETVISQGSIPAPGTIRAKDHPYQMARRDDLMQIAGSRVLSNLSGLRPSRLSPLLSISASSQAAASRYRGAA